jgi:hypothetical protein
MQSPEETALRLLDNGYHPLAIERGTKKCSILGWSRWCATAPTVQDVHAWALDPVKFAGVGIAAGGVVAIDIDLLDQAEADRLEALARERFGDTPLRRVGKAPKRLLVYRAHHAPAVHHSRVGLDIIGNLHQFVAFAIHPDTGRPYEWGEHTPLDVPASALPEVSDEQVIAFLEVCGLPDAGAGGGDGGGQPIAVDPATNLVVDGRERWLRDCVYSAANHDPEGGPERWANEAWQHFKNTTDLVTRPSRELTHAAALQKARYAARRIRSGRLGLKGLPSYDRDDFYAYLPQHSFIFVPGREMWPSSSVDARLEWTLVNGKRVAPSRWIMAHRAVEQMTWAPGEGEVAEDRLIDDGGWIPRKGCRVFNQYRAAPTLTGGDAAQAGPWLELLKTLYPEEWEHILRWLAHRCQRPGEKINHGLILGGNPGVGKDSLLAPVKVAVGYWNMREVSPATLVEPFNGWVKSVILRVSEARDLGGNELSAANRYSLYEHVKTLTAAPPEVIRVNEKHVKQYGVFNVVGLLVTTNYRDGMYLPQDDRRFYVGFSERVKEDWPAGYFDGLHAWYVGGGHAHVADYLRRLDLSPFNPKSPPPMTAAKAAMIDAGRDDSSGPVGDALDLMRSNGVPTDAFTLDALLAYMNDEVFRATLSDPKNSKRAARLLTDAGYERALNDSNKGRWIIDGRRQYVYARRELPVAERNKLAAGLQEAGRSRPADVLL